MSTSKKCYLKFQYFNKNLPEIKIDLNYIIYYPKRNDIPLEVCTLFANNERLIM